MLKYTCVNLNVCLILLAMYNQVGNLYILYPPASKIRGNIVMQSVLPSRFRFHTLRWFSFVSQLQSSCIWGVLSQSAWDYFSGQNVKITLTINRKSVSAAYLTSSYVIFQL